MNKLILLVPTYLLLSCTGPARYESGPESRPQPSPDPAITAPKKELFSLVLVRHAEKTTESSDPGLTELGKKRAEFFASWLEAMHMQAIWSSDYRRSRDTALPLSGRLDLPLRLYDPGDLQSFKDELLFMKENAFVVGHSNTTPELAALLCSCEIEAMNHSEYDLAYLIVSLEGKIAVSEIDLEKLWIDRPADLH